MNSDILKSYGIDYEKGRERCLGDADFYAQLLDMFLEDTAFERAEQALNQKDYKTLFECMHELKGSAGNVDLSELFCTVSPLVELLRGGSDDDERIAKLFSEVSCSYAKACKGIRLALQ